MTMVSELHNSAMLTKIALGQKTKDYSLSLQEAGMERQNFEFVIHGWSDSNYVKNSENWRSTLVTRVFLVGFPAMFKTEAKLSAGATNAHIM